MGKEECGVKEMYNFWGNAISIYTAGEIIVAKKNRYARIHFL